MLAATPVRSPDAHRFREREPARRLSRAAVAAVVLVVASCGSVGVDRRDDHGMTALMRAAQRGDAAEAARLIERGADVNATVPPRDVRELIAFISWMQQLPHSDIGYTPLHYAVLSGRADVARLLIRHGADVNRRSDRAMRAIELAIVRSDVAMLEALQAGGARADRAELVTAVSQSTLETVQMLLAHGAHQVPAPPRTHGPGPPSLGPMGSAVRRAEPAIVEALLVAGLDPNERDRRGWTPLRWARDLERDRSVDPQNVAAIVALLRQAGASDVAGERGATLLEAVAKGSSEQVRAALAAGANANVADARGVPPLVHAAARGDLAIVDALIETGANVNARPEPGGTPLIAAIESGRVEVVRRLIDAGARITLADRHRRTPLQAATESRRREIARLLIESSPVIDPGALAVVAFHGEAGLVRLLLDRGADPDADRVHALAQAVRGCHGRDNVPVISMLLAAGANPNRQAADGPPLLHAAGTCPAAVVRLLVARGANPNTRDRNGITPLINAAMFGRAENARVLIEAGADVNARDLNRKTALYYAHEHPAVREVLQAAGGR